MSYSVTISDRETGDIIAQCGLDELPAMLAILEGWEETSPFNYLLPADQMPEWVKRVMAERRAR